VVYAVMDAKIWAESHFITVYFWESG